MNADYGLAVLRDECGDFEELWVLFWNGDLWSSPECWGTFPARVFLTLAARRGTPAVSQTAGSLLVLRFHCCGCGVRISTYGQHWCGVYLRTSCL